MLNLLNFFEDTTNNTGTWQTVVTYIVIGLALVGLVLMTVIPNRRNKKRAEEMLAKLDIGSVITTIGGIVGTVVKLDDQNVWLETGTEDNKTVMQFVRKAIYAIEPAPGSEEAKALEQQKKEDEVDEIK